MFERDPIYQASIYEETCSAGARIAIRAVVSGFDRQSHLSRQEQMDIASPEIGEHARMLIEDNPMGITSELRMLRPNQREVFEPVLRDDEAFRISSGLIVRILQTFDNYTSSPLVSYDLPPVKRIQ